MRAIDKIRQEIKIIKENINKLEKSPKSYCVFSMASIKQLYDIIDNLVNEVERITYLLQLDTSSCPSKICDNDAYLFKNKKETQLSENDKLME